MTTVVTYGSRPWFRHISATFICREPYRYYSMQPQHYGCVVGEVITRKPGTIPGCVPVVPNSASHRDIRWPEQDPYIQDYDGTMIRVSVRTWLNNLYEEVRQSRRQRNVDY